MKAHATIALLCLTVLVALPAAALLLAAAPAVAGEARDVGAAMKAPVEDFRFEGTLEQALEKLSALAGVPIRADWTALAAAGIRREEPITLSAEKATVADLLDQTLKQVRRPPATIASFAQAGAMRVTTGAALAAEMKAADPAAARAGGRAIDFEKAALKDVLEFLRAQSKLNFNVNWKSLALVGIEPETPVSVHVSGVTYERVLDLVVEQLAVGQDKFGRVYWLVQDGIVMIGSGASFNEGLKTKVFDVADLLMVTPNYKGPRLKLDQGSGSGTGGGLSGTGSVPNPGAALSFEQSGDQNGQDKQEAARQKAQDNLIEIVRGLLEPDMWSDGGGKGSVRIVGNKMLVTQTPLGFKLLEKALK